VRPEGDSDIWNPEYYDRQLSESQGAGRSGNIGSVSETPSRSSAQTVERAIAILNLFRDQPASLGITSIARQTGLNLTTAHRLVRTLVQEHFMEQDPTNERYRLGPALAVLGRRAVEGSGLDRARPTTERLSEATGESVSVGVRGSGGVMVVLQSSSRHALRFEHPAGSAIDLHASAMGKVLLAFGETAPGTAIGELGRLPRFTASTITTSAALLAELEQVRVDGFAANRQERYDGVCGVAAPVLDTIGVARFAIGIQGPSVRLSDERLLELGPLLVRTGREVADLVLAGR
jgi:IclR family acetate operon transcriptional repressor